MNDPLEPRPRDPGPSIRPVDFSRSPAGRDRETRRRDELRDAARREAFRRAVCGQTHGADVRFVTSPPRRDPRAELGAALANALLARLKAEGGAIDRLAAVVGLTESWPGETCRAEDEEPGPEAPREPPATEPAAPAGMPNGSGVRGAGLPAGADDGGGGDSGRRSFDLADRFAAFAAIRSSAEGSAEVELRLDTSFAGDVSVVMTALGDRRVALRVRAAGSRSSSLDLTGLVAEMRDAGLVVVKAPDDESEGAG